MDIRLLWHRVLIALLAVGSAISLSSCEEKESAGEEAQPMEQLMTEYSENRTVTTTLNGKKKYIFFTPLLEGYTAGKEPYREFRKGVKITTFNEDSANVVDVTLTANYAIYYEKRKLWEAKGDVVVIKADGKKLYTEQLFWNATTKKIYSNVDSKIVQPDGEFLVSGFESDEEFVFWSAREMDGHMEVEFSPTEPDTTAVEKKTTTPKSSEVKRPATRPNNSVDRAARGQKSPSAQPMTPEEKRKLIEERRRKTAERQGANSPTSGAVSPAKTNVQRTTAELPEKSISPARRPKLTPTPTEQ